MVNVKDFGAFGDGITNDTLAIQTAIDSDTIIYFPAGNYLIDTVELNDNTEIYGDGIGTTKLKNTGSFSNPFGSLMIATSINENSKISNIYIHDLTFYGQSDVLGFSEFNHLLYLVGVDNVLISDCEFKGFRGDGIDLGGVSLYEWKPRHNSNVTIQNCIFDGINKENRNAISVIDGVNVIIRNCDFKNCSRKNMPGAIDFEPDNEYNIISQALVENCNFSNIGGNAGVIGIAIKDINYYQFPSNFVIQNNTITNSTNINGALFYLYLKNGVNENEGICNVSWIKNDISLCSVMFLINNANGLKIQDCIFSDIDGSGYLPLIVNNLTNCVNIEISNCYFNKCGKIVKDAIIINNVKNLYIKENQFIDCGDGSQNSSAIHLLQGGCFNLNIINNIFNKPQNSVKINPYYKLENYNIDSQIQQQDRIKEEWETKTTLQIAEIDDAQTDVIVKQEKKPEKQKNNTLKIVFVTIGVIGLIYFIKRND